MENLVELKNNEAFTNSKVIAEGTRNQHKNVREIIQKYEKVFEETPELGKVTFKTEPLPSGQKEKIYLLNEGQAMFLMTLLRNDGVNGIVVRFKARLTSEFMRMKQFIKERQSQNWENIRIAGKQTRLQETYVIKQLAEYAKEQGSGHSDKLYLVYSKLAKTVVQNKRDELTITELNTLNMIENMILKTIQADMCLNMGYKQIYQDCKNRLEQFKNIMYLA